MPIDRYKEQRQTAGMRSKYDKNIFIIRKTLRRSLYLSCKYIIAITPRESDRQPAILPFTLLVTHILIGYLLLAYPEPHLASLRLELYF